MPSSLDSLQFGPCLDVAARTSAGASSAHALENQDNFLLVDGTGRAMFMVGQQLREQQLAAWPRGHARLAVLDGMGGHGQGRQVAEAVVAGLLAMPACSTLAALSAHLDLLHARLQQQFAADAEAGSAKRPGTTLTLLELRPGQAPLLYHVGDSRLYEITRDKAHPMTVDHVPATAFAMAGLLDEQEWWQQVHAEHRSQISQAFVLGNAFADPAVLSDPLYELSPRNLPPYLHHLSDRRAIELRLNALYLLATDGFWACAAPDAWVARWPGLFHGQNSARSAVDSLFDEMSRSPPQGLYIDNITAIVLRTRPGADDTALPQRTREKDS